MIYGVVGVSAAPYGLKMASTAAYNSWDNHR